MAHMKEIEIFRTDLERRLSETRVNKHRLSKALGIEYASLFRFATGKADIMGESLLKLRRFVYDGWIPPPDLPAPAVSPPPTPTQEAGG
jgi:hypothetical protein